MHVHTGFADEREDGRERNGFRGRGNRREPEPRRHFAVVSDAAVREMRFLGTQPYAVAER